MIAYLQKKDNKLIFTGTVLEAYVPDNLFKKGLNEYHGDKINLFGIFNFRLGNNKDLKIDNNSKLLTFNFPSIMTTKPAMISVKELELLPGAGLTKYHVFTYYKDDYLMTSTNVVKGIDNVKIFLDLLINANLPNTLAYENILRLFFKCLEMNGETGGVPGVIESVIVSELCRLKEDPSIPFRKIIGKGKTKVSQFDYVLSNARSVCANNSTFSGLTFEDIDTMLVYSINKKRYNKKENESPLEKIIKV